MKLTTHSSEVMGPSAPHPKSNLDDDYEELPEGILVPVLPDGYPVGSYLNRMGGRRPHGSVLMAYVVKDKTSDVWIVMRGHQAELVTKDHMEALNLASCLNLI